MFNGSEFKGKRDTQWKSSSGFIPTHLVLLEEITVRNFLCVFLKCRVHTQPHVHGLFSGTFSWIPVLVCSSQYIMLSFALSSMSWMLPSAVHRVLPCIPHSPKNIGFLCCGFLSGLPIESCLSWCLQAEGITWHVLFVQIVCRSQTAASGGAHLWFQHLGGRDRSIDASLRPLWAAWSVWGQPGLYIKILSQKESQ